MARLVRLNMLYTGGTLWIDPSHVRSLDDAVRNMDYRGKRRVCVVSLDNGDYYECDAEDGAAAQRILGAIEPPETRVERP